MNRCSSFQINACTDPESANPIVATPLSRNSKVLELHQCSSGLANQECDSTLVKETMEILELRQYRGLLDCVLGFLGRGEYYLALASTEVLGVVARNTDRDNDQSVAEVVSIKVPERKASPAGLECGWDKGSARPPPESCRPVP